MLLTLENLFQNGKLSKNQLRELKKRNNEGLDWIASELFILFILTVAGRQLRQSYGKRQKYK